MTHPLKVRHVGSSLGVLMPKEVTSALNVKEGDTVYLVQAKDGFRLVAHDPNFGQAMEAFQDIARRYRNTFKELSK